MGEKSLHDAIKRWYACSDDKLETEIGEYIIDIVRGNMLIEIQTRNFSAIKTKLRNLVRHNPIRLVHPIAQKKWIIRVDIDGKTILSRRKSPIKGRVEDLFSELVYIPTMVKNPNFSLEVLLIRSEQILINDGQGSWRRKGWSIHDQRLLNVVSRVTFSNPSNFHALLPAALSKVFTSRDLAKALNLSLNKARKMAYCLRHMGAVQVVGKRGQALIYTLAQELMHTP